MAIRIDKQFPDRYLADGVFASFDGIQVWLRTQREDGFVHQIAIDEEVFEALVRYRQDIRQFYKLLRPTTQLDEPDPDH